MPENRLARTRAAYESTDPMNRLARIYLKHASGLIRDGRAAEAVSAIDEAVRILGAPVSYDDGIKSTPLTKLFNTRFDDVGCISSNIRVVFPECALWHGR